MFVHVTLGSNLICPELTPDLFVSPYQVVPFCGVFLKELNDALDGTASIISLKAPLDNAEESIEVPKCTQTWAVSVNHSSLFDLFSWCCSLCQTIAASTTSCRGVVLMVYTSQRKKLQSATFSRLSGTVHPFESDKYALYPLDFRLKLSFWDLFVPDTPVILLLFCSDLVIAVWRWKTSTRAQPVLLLVVHPLLPETTPSGTAAVISQSSFFSSFLTFT